MALARPQQPVSDRSAPARAMKVVEIVASTANPSYGPSYSVPRIAAALARAGARVELFTVSEEPGERDLDGVVHRRFQHDLARVPIVGPVRLSRALDRALQDRASGGTDILHTHGLWLAPNVYPAHAARAAGKAFVLSPRGMLGPAALAFSRGRKQVFWALFQRRALAGAAFIHATSESELDEIRAMGLTNPVAVIPNGVDVPAPKPFEAREERIALSLGRIHPKKGLDRLIAAWAMAGDATARWKLRIVGPDDDGHGEDLRGQIARLGLTNVEIAGPVFGDDKLAALRQASLFILPTLNENFALTVAESLAAGTPVISTKGAPWAGLTQEGCGWWIDHGEAAMAQTLGQALAMPEEVLAQMGERGRSWMLRDFGWDHIGRRMLAAYEWAARGGDAPAELRL